MTALPPKAEVNPRVGRAIKFRNWGQLDKYGASVRREAVNQAGPADPLQVRRSAARRFVRVVPEVDALGVADQIVVTHHRAALAISAAGPIAAGCIVRARNGCAISLGAS